GRQGIRRQRGLTRSGTTKNAKTAKKTGPCRAVLFVLFVSILRVRRVEAVLDRKLSLPRSRQRQAGLRTPRHDERIATIHRGSRGARRDLGDERVAAGHAQTQLAMVAEVDHLLELRIEM